MIPKIQVMKMLMMLRQSLKSTKLRKNLKKTDKGYNEFECNTFIKFIENENNNYVNHIISIIKGQKDETSIL